ncbi:MAG: trigger factor [Chloroflexota bacterium]|nr:trigger factor [Chloroflexota bacterium]
MKVQKEDLGNCQVQLTVEVDEARVEQAMRAAAKKVGRDVNIPGFRRGKAPYHLVVQAVGERALMQEAIEELLPDVLGEALDEAEVEPYRPFPIEPHLEDTSPLTFRFVVPTEPVVKLGDPSYISLDPKEVAVEQEQVDEVLENLRRQRATLEPSLGPAEYGDQVTIDLVGQMMDGTTLEEQEGVEVTLVDRRTLEEEEGEAEPRPEPDLRDEMVGMMVNQVKEVPVVYPAEWPEARLRNRTVLYKITLLDLKKRREPELDDEFAQEVGDFGTLEELRERIRTSLTAEAEDEEFGRQIEAALDGLVDESELLYPDFMVEYEVGRRIESIERQLKPYKITLDQYLESIEQTREELEDDLWDAAEEFVRRSLVLSEYVRQHDITVTEEEVERELALILSAYDPDTARSLRERIQANEEDMDQVRGRLLTRKALYELHHEVTGEEKPPLFPEVEEEEVEEVEAPDLLEEPAREEALQEHVADLDVESSAEAVVSTVPDETAVE